MKSAVRSFRDDHQKNVVAIFDRLCYRHSRWTVWADFITITAIEISNAVDRVNATARSKTYQSTISKYSDAERDMFAEMLAQVVIGMDENPDQDFLGELFMRLDLGNEHRGQFFTPYCVCRMMSAISFSDLKDKIAQNGWVSVNDCCCGAGALLVAFANECLRNGINYQTSVLFVAQDIDFVVGCMCYIQLSLLGCAGYVIIADTLSHPSVSHDERGLLPVHGENVWYMPLYFHDVWHFRKALAHCSLLTAVPKAERKIGMSEDNTPVEAMPTLRIKNSGQLSFF